MTEDSGERRQSNNSRQVDNFVVEMLRDQTDRVTTRLETHISECARQQKYVKWSIVSVLGWLVTHSPEFSAFIGRIFGHIQ